MRSRRRLQQRLLGTPITSPTPFIAALLGKRYLRTIQRYLRMIQMNHVLVGTFTATTQ